MRIEQVRDCITELMEERGWNKYRLSQNCKINDSTIYNIFVDEKLPSLTTLQAICDGCKITLADFFKDDEKSGITLVDRDYELVNISRKLDDVAHMRLVTYAQGLLDQYKNN